MNNFELTENELQEYILASQEGESEAFGKIYDHFLTPIYRYVFYKVPENEVEDLTEVVFLKAWQSIRSYKQGKTRFSAWLFRIAHNTVVDFYRTNRDVLELAEYIEDERNHIDPKKLTEQEFLRKDVKMALTKLSETQSEIIILKFFNNLSNAEIAQYLGKKEGAVRVLQMRALQKLKEIMEKM